MHLIYLIHEFHNLSWITEINFPRHANLLRCMFVSVDTEKHQKKDAFMVLVHLHEHAIVVLQEGMRTADVAKAIVRLQYLHIRRQRQCHRETGMTADSPCSGKPHVTICPPRNVWECENAIVGGWSKISQQELVNLVQSMRMRCSVVL